MTAQLKAHPRISFFNEEVTDVAKLIDAHSYVLFATGPLTSDALATSLQDILGTQYLSFYDSIAPVVTAASIDKNLTFRASRYGKGEADYLNYPMHRGQCQSFIEAVQQAEKVDLH